MKPCAPAHLVFVCWLVVFLAGAHGLEAQALGLREEVRIGAVEGAPELEFQRIRAIGVGHDGTLYVGDGGSLSVRVFGKDGKYLRSIGRRGSGPGEFRSVSRIIVVRDSVFVLDLEASRMTGFRNDGRVLRDWALGSVNRSTLPLQFVGHGWFVEMWEANLEPRQLGAYRADSVRVALASYSQSPTTVPRTIASYESKRMLGIQTTRGVVGTTVLFSPRGSHAADQRGLLYVSRGDDYRIEIHDTAGRVVRTLTRSYDVRPITRAHVKQYTDEVNEWAAGARLSPVARALQVEPQIKRAEIATQNAFPPIGTLLVSASGTLMVERPDLLRDPVGRELPIPSRQQVTWDVFDTRAVFVGSVAVPANVTPLAVTENGFVGVLRGDLDVEYVVRYAFALR